MKRSLFIFALVAMSLTTVVKAAWLNNVPQTIKQPDGTIIHCLASGDEFYHWLHDENGYTIVQNSADGYFYYAFQQGEEVAPTAHKVNSVDPAAVGLTQNVRISNRLYAERKAQFLSPLKGMADAPTTGQVNNISVYISFADDSVFSRSREYFHDFYSGEDMSSLKDYYHEVSYERLFLDTYHYPVSSDTIHVTYVDIHPRSYYLKKTGNNPNGYDEGESRDREHALLERAMKFIENQLPNDIDFDANGDGRIDNVCFVMQGSPAGWSDLLWPHRWSLYSRDVRIKGLRVMDYLLMLESTFNVGTLCHEMFHVLGAPDLYHYNSNGAPTACGAWDIMDASQNPPQYMGAYMKHKYGDWIAELPEITESGTYTIYPLQNPEQNIYKIKSPMSDSEFFVLEYRKKEGRYDSRAPSTGLVVYRINTAARGNAQGPPDEVYVYRPDGTLTTNGTFSSATLGHGQRRSMNDHTNPSSFLYNNGNGGRGGLDLFNVSDAGGDSITFEVNIIPLYPPSDLSYELGNNNVFLNWYPTAAVGFKHYRVYRNGVEIANPIQSFYSDTDIIEGTEYTYMVTAIYEGDVSGESEPTNTVFALPLGVMELPYTEDFEERTHGWLIKGSKDGFRWGNAEDLDITTTNSTHFLGALSEHAGRNTHTIDFAISPRLNLSSANSVWLTLDYALKVWYRLDELKIYFRPSRSHPWTFLLKLPRSGIGQDYQWRTFALELPNEALSAEAQIGIRYNDKDDYGYGGAIDNIEIKEPASGLTVLPENYLISIFPNPAGNHTTLHLQMPGQDEVLIRMINPLGQEIYRRKLENPVEHMEKLDISMLPAGVNYLIIETDQQIILKKFVKQ